MGAAFQRLWGILGVLVLSLSIRDEGGESSWLPAPVAQAQAAHFHHPAASRRVVPPQAATEPVCPTDMVLVEGAYCPKLRHYCSRWLDEPSLPYARCASYERRVDCLEPTVRLRFCIDREEYPEVGSRLPKNQLSFVLAERLCRANGKRLCEEREWNFACEGEEMRPYPYGWDREAKCNQDRTELVMMIDVGNGRKQVLRDLRAGSDEFPECLSPFGVHHLVGNVDEPVVREGAGPAVMQMALKGGWWMAGRNRCRPATTAHDIYYRDLQVGARCCADAADVR